MSQEQTALRRHGYAVFSFSRPCPHPPSSSLQQLVRRLRCLSCHPHPPAASFYASKSCTYTDASGRPVPAPRSFSTERNDPPPSSQSHPTQYPDANRFSPSNPAPSAPSIPTMVTDITDDDDPNIRKKTRNDRENVIPAKDAPTDGPISGPSMERPIHVKLDHVLTRELTNCKLERLKEAFSLSMAPQYFLRIAIQRGLSSTSRHSPQRSATIRSRNISSTRFVRLRRRYLSSPESGRIRRDLQASRSHRKPCPSCSMGRGGLYARRVLQRRRHCVCSRCMTSSPKTRICGTTRGTTVRRHRRSCDVLTQRRADLALQIVKGLGVYSPDHLLLTPLPSPEFIQSSVERESLRRVFWLIQMLDVMIAIYFKRPLNTSECDLRVRLPADETSFELAVHSTLPGN